MNFPRSLNRCLLVGATALLLGAPGLAQAQLGRVNAPGTDLGNAAFVWSPGADYTGSGFSFLTANAGIDVTAALNWNGVGTPASGTLSSVTGTYTVGIYRAQTTLSDNSNVPLPNAPQARVSVCNDLFNSATSDSVVDWFKLTGNEQNSNKNKLAYLVDGYMGYDGSSFAASAATLISDINVSASEAGAGFQLAVWELWYDDGASLAAKGLDSGARGFKVTSASADILKAANAFLTDASKYGGSYNSLTALRLRDFTSATDNSLMQGMLISSRSPIPEPAFYQMAGLLTMGMLGMRRLRKKA